MPFHFRISQCVLTLASVAAFAMAAPTEAGRNLMYGQGFIAQKEAAPPDTFLSWTALGDGGAAVGADKDFDSNEICHRTQDAYPNAIATDADFPGKGSQFEFAACDGARTPDVVGTQLDGVTHSSDLVTLSVGADDVSMSPLMLGCVYGLGSTSCPDLITETTNLMYGTDFYANYFNMMDQILLRGLYTTRLNSSTLVYQTSYPAVFESNTTSCDSTSMAFWQSSNIPLTQDFRRQINQMIQELNYIMSYWIDNYNLNFGGNGTVSAVAFADSDQQYSGNRLCSDGVNATATDVTPWINTYAPENDTVVAASSWTSMNASTCAESGTESFGNLFQCYVAQGFAANSSMAPAAYAATTAPDSVYRMMHPASLGHVATRDYIVSALEQDDAVLWSKNYKVLALGDSITWGFHSTQFQGYRETLYFRLQGDNNSVEFIGSQGNVSQPWGLNEGYPGYTVRMIRDNSTATGVYQEQPNVILLMAGTNDINNNITGGLDDVATTPGRLSDFIDFLTESCPDAVVMVSHIPAIGWDDFGPVMSAKQRQVVAYNAAISGIVNEKRARGMKVVKTHSSVTTNPIDHYPSDTLHPNDHGYSKLGTDWLQGFYEANQMGWIKSV